MISIHPSGETRLSLIDRGLELEVPPEGLSVLRTLMLYVHSGRSLDDSVCQELLVRLGVGTTDHRMERQFEAQAEGLSLLSALSGADTSEQAEKAKFVTMPGWMRILLKAVSA